MTCDDFLRRLDAAGDGDPADARAAALHAAGCGDCRRAADEARRLEEALRSAFEPRRQAADALATRVVRQLGPAPRRRLIEWRTAGVALAAAAVGFLLAWVIYRPVPPASPTEPQLARKEEGPPPLQLAVATGAVEVCEGEVWKAMPTGGRLDYGCRVRTPPAVRCEFRTPDGSEVRLDGSSEVVIRNARHVNLASGRLWSSVAPAAQPFRVETALGVVTALGTQFDVAKSAEALTLLVLSGKTRLQNGATTVDVGEGERSVAQAGSVGAAERLPQHELLQATNWVNDILLLKGRSNPELVRRIDDLFAQIGQTKTAFLHEEEIRVLGDGCVMPLTRYVQSDRSQDDPHKRRQAARILGDLAQPWSIKDLINLLDDQDGEVRASAAAALRRLTGQSFGMEPQQWRAASPAACGNARGSWAAWWGKNQYRCPGPPS